MMTAGHKMRKSSASLTAVVKDCFDLHGAPTWAGSRILERLRPGPHEDAELVRRAREANLCIIGKTQMNEFAYGLDGRNAHYGDCPHPVLPDTLSGGSSSGSAVAVARGEADVGFGTDTGGSIRVPSAFCGLYGLRLVPGLLCGGCFPLAPSYDTVGWMTKSAETMAMVTEAMGITSAAAGADTPLQTLGLEHPMVAELDPLCPALKIQIAKRGRHEWDRDFAISRCMQAFKVLQSSEALEIHREWLEPEAEHYDPGTFARIERARHWSDADRAEARAAANELQCVIQKTFASYDLLVLPVAEEPPPRAEAMDDAFRTALLRNTVIASLGSLPALTIPVPGNAFRWCGLQIILPPDRWRPILATLLKRFRAITP